ncbi:MAG: hypothetical protein RLZZ387_5066 [Chloroflexota bacterium]|jgi:probable F420-dependent oxidoreductase
MRTHRPFRFTTGMMPQSRAEWVAFVRKVESQGYAAVSTGEHPESGGLAPFVLFMAAADATERLRFVTHTLNNALRHPALLAQEAATFDLLSGGRLELGIGAGWSARDFHALGLTLPPGNVRLARLAEAVALIKQLLAGGPVTFTGEHYRVEALDLQIPAAQQPRLPIFIGGGRRRLLQYAAREADMVGLDMRSQSGGLDMASFTAAAMDERVAWVRAAAGERFDQLELHSLVHFAIVTEDSRAALRQIQEQLAAFREMGIATGVELTDAEIRESPYVLVGTVREIVETLRERRERYGISHISVFAGDTFHPVVEQLAGVGM